MAVLDQFRVKCKWHSNHKEIFGRDASEMVWEQMIFDYRKIKNSSQNQNLIF